MPPRTGYRGSGAAAVLLLPPGQEIHEGLAKVRCPCGSAADIVHAVCEAADTVEDVDTQLSEARVVG